MTLWDVMKQYYKEKYNMPNKVFELIGCLNILEECLYGKSNKSIAKFFGIDVDYVSNVLIALLDFPGWDRDLHFSPLALYNKSNKDYQSYCEEMAMINPFFDEKSNNITFNLCEKYYKFRKDIDNYYDKTA